LRKYQYLILLFFTSLILLLIRLTEGSSTKTIGLETYISEENGYSIKYPIYAELKEIETDGIVNKIRWIEILGPKIFFASRSDYPAYRLRIITHENPDNLSAKNWAQQRLLKEWRERKPDAQFTGPVTGDGKIDEGLVIDTQINGLPAYQEQWESKDFSVIHTYIANEKRVYELIYEDYPIATYPITNVAKDIYFMMLSTFEIIPIPQGETDRPLRKQSEQSEHGESSVVWEEKKEPDDNTQKTVTVVSQTSDTITMAKTGIVLGNGVRVRDKPTIADSQIVLKLGAGDKVEILDGTKTKDSFSKIEGILLNGGYPWYKVKKNNDIGWIYGQLLQPLKPPSGVSVIKIDLYSQSVWYSESYSNSEDEGGQDVTEYYLPLPEWSYHKTYIPLKYDICAYLLNNSSKTARNLTLELKVYYLLGTMTDNPSIPKDANWTLAHTFSRKVKSLPAGRLTKIFVKGIDFEDDYNKLVTSNDGWIWKVKVEAKVQVAGLPSQPYQSEIMIIHGE